MFIIKYANDLVVYAWPYNHWMSLNTMLQEKLNAEIQIHKDDVLQAAFYSGSVVISGFEALALQRFAERYGVNSFELVKYVPNEP